MTEVGKLYKSTDIYILCFPDEASISRATSLKNQSIGFVRSEKNAIETSRYWSYFFRAQVSFISPDEPFLILREDDRFIEILRGDKKGWILKIIKTNPLNNIVNISHS
jgi:hypothetical protein